MKQELIQPHRFGLAAAIVSSILSVLLGTVTAFGMHNTQYMMMGAHMGFWIGPVGIIYWVIQATIIGYIAGFGLIWIYNALS